MAIFGFKKTLRRIGKKLVSSVNGKSSSRRSQRQHQPTTSNNNAQIPTIPTASSSSAQQADNGIYASVTPLHRSHSLLRRNKSISARRAAEERINVWCKQLLEQYPHVQEWKIPYSELELGSALPLRTNQHGALYRGKWHGNVVVYEHQNLTNVDFFFGLVHLLDRLRHDGLTLYLGACIDAHDKLAIVFDATAVITLEDLITNKISMSRDRSFAALWRQALQLAEAMEYLHCKGVVMGSNLAASNVLVDANGRAKLSLLDFGVLCSCTGRGFQPKHRTTTVFARLPPEVLSSVCQSHTEYMRNAWSRGADVYAFGCLLYEIFTDEQLMYSPTSVIGQSMIEMTPNSVMPQNIRQIVLACCAPEPSNRPTFELIVGALLNAQPVERPSAEAQASSSFSTRCTSVPNLPDSTHRCTAELKSGHANEPFNDMGRTYQLHPMSQSVPTSPRVPMVPIRTTSKRLHVAEHQGLVSDGVWQNYI